MIAQRGQILLQSLDFICSHFMQKMSAKIRKFADYYYSNRYNE